MRLRWQWPGSRSKQSRHTRRPERTIDKKLVHRLDGIMRCEVLVVDAPERLHLAGAGRLSSLGRSAELLQMQIGDAVFVERCGKLPLGKARLAEAATARVSTSNCTLAFFSAAITASGRLCS